MGRERWVICDTSAIPDREVGSMTAEPNNREAEAPNPNLTARDALTKAADKLWAVEQLARCAGQRFIAYEIAAVAATLVGAKTSEMGVEVHLAWLGEQRRVYVEFYSPVYADDDDQSEEWRVVEVGGSINDREHTIIGRGETPIEAIRKARILIHDRSEPLAGPPSEMEIRN
jgi:hypothetical protein